MHFLMLNAQERNLGRMRKVLIFVERSEKGKKWKKIRIIRQRHLGDLLSCPCCCILGLGCYSEFKDSEIFKAKKQSIPCRAEEGREPQRALGRGSG